MALSATKFTKKTINVNEKYRDSDRNDLGASRESHRKVRDETHAEHGYRPKQKTVTCLQKESERSCFCHYIQTLSFL